MERHWTTQLAERILAEPHYTQLRWRKTPEPILAGEAIAVLNENGLKAYPARVKALATLLPIIAKDPTLFYTSEGFNGAFNARLGELLANRVNGLSNQDTVANSHLKTWMQSDQAAFCNFYLPRLLAFNTRAKQPVKIPLDKLFNMLSSWEHRKDDIVTSITSEYFRSESRKEITK